MIGMQEIEQYISLQNVLIEFFVVPPEDLVFLFSSCFIWVLAFPEWLTKMQGKNTFRFPFVLLIYRF